MRALVLSCLVLALQLWLVVPTSAATMEECINRYCPSCAGSVNLLGQSASQGCEACKRQRRNQISQCAHQRVDGGGGSGGQTGGNAAIRGEQQRGHCYVGFNNATRRYAAACDGNDGPATHKLTSSGYTSIVLGPTTWQQCRAYIDSRRTVDPGPPPANRCYVGFNNATRRYAAACDGNDGPATHKLTSSGYTSIVLGPTTWRQCRAYIDSRRTVDPGPSRLNRCYVGFNNATRRYGVACDGNDGLGTHKLLNSGYTSIVHGPSNWEDCQRYIGSKDLSRRPGQCYVGFNNATRRYGVACDGNDGPGTHKLLNSGYTSIVHGPSNWEDCQRYVQSRSQGRR